MIASDDILHKIYRIKKFHDKSFKVAPQFATWIKSKFKSHLHERQPPYLA